MLLHRRDIGRVLVLVALAGVCAAVGATPGDENPARRRTARISAPFVPAIELDSVPGFRMKMRGERIAYCRMEQKIGTRFRTEVCIDQAHIRAYLAALEENRDSVRQLRTGENRIN